LADKGSACDCLTQTLTAAQNAYQQGHDSGLSDSEYDGLKDYILELGCDSKPALVPVSSQSTVALFAPMGSLHKVYEFEAARAFLHEKTNQKWIIQPKLDGVAIELLYSHGQLIQAATRGDGQVGQNVLALLRRISLPLKLPIDDIQVIRGELIASKVCYEAFSEHYSSQRLFVAALVNSNIQQSDDRQSKMLRCLHFYPYYWLNTNIESEVGTLQQLLSWGFADMLRLSLPVTANTLQLQAHELDGLHQLPVDGYVVKLDERTLRSQDSDSQYRPKWALAWKNSSPAVIAQILSIDWRLGRTGRLTPVLHIKELKINGRKITQLSGSSYAWLKKHNISQGALITVSLKGEVIAQMDDVLSSGGSELTIPKALLKASEPALCLQATEVCKDRFWQQIAYSLKKLGVKSLSNKKLRLWIYNLPLRSWQQIFSLTKQQWQPLLGAQTLATMQLLEEMQKNDDGLAILSLLGPRGLGKVKIKALIESFPKFSELSKANVQQLKSVHGIGKKQAKDLVTLLNLLKLGG